MGWGAALGAVVGLYGAKKQSDAAKSASKAQQQASAAAIAEQRRQFDAMQANLAPYMQFGQGGISGLNALMAGDYSGFKNSPDYLYARDQAIYGLDHSAAARGALYRGGHSVDLANALNGIASQNLGNYRNALQWQTNLGQNAAAGVGQAGMNSANSIGNYLMAGGDARANSALAQGNIWGNALSGLGGLLAYGTNPAQRTSTYGSSGGGSMLGWMQGGY